MIIQVKEIFIIIEEGPLYVRLWYQIMTNNVFYHINSISFPLKDSRQVKEVGGPIPFKNPICSSSSMPEALFLVQN